MVGCYNGLQVSCFGDFEKFVLAYIACPHYPTYRVYRLYDKTHTMLRIAHTYSGIIFSWAPIKRICICM